MKDARTIIHEQCRKHDGAMLAGSVKWIECAIFEYADQIRNESDKLWREEIKRLQEENYGLRKIISKRI